MLHRYQFPNGLKLYAQNVEEIKHMGDGEPIEIPFVSDTSIMYLKSILSVSNQLGDNIYSFPYNGSEIIFCTFKYNEEFLDGIKYQRHDEHKLIKPFLKTICSIEEFYNKFYSDQDRLPPAYLSKREFDKIKPKPICFDKKGQYKKYVDENEYIYLVPSRVPWSKKGMDLWNEFKDKPDAVCVRFYHKTFGYLDKRYEYCGWYNNEQEAIDACVQMNIDHPEYYNNATYEVVQRGFNPTHPKDLKWIIRLPYFNFNNVEDIKGASNSWIDSGKGFKWIDYNVSGYNRPYLVEFFEDVIKKYLEYKNN